ncbi:MAG TPA: hypothetical protein VEC38_00465 [Candidatus Binataceae bacterium]|nr:hypothetical protein [Candidatus Binataceae bacterium]
MLLTPRSTPVSETAERIARPAGHPIFLYLLGFKANHVPTNTRLRRISSERITVLIADREGQLLIRKIAINLAMCERFRNLRTTAVLSGPHTICGTCDNFAAPSDELMPLAAFLQRCVQQ